MSSDSMSWSYIQRYLIFFIIDKKSITSRIILGYWLKNVQQLNFVNEFSPSVGQLTVSVLIISLLFTTSAVVVKLTGTVLQQLPCCCTEGLLQP